MAVKEKIVITADDKTARAFRSVQRSAKRTADDLAAMSLKMAGIATVGVAAAAALFLVTKRALDNASALSDAADKIGLGVEALQELRFAAEQAGVEQKTLDMAMQRFSRRVGEAAQGSGELRATLEQYNIAVKDSEGNTRALEDVLGDYADAIANAGSEQEQLRLAFKGFDSEGAALVNMLRGGEDALNAMRMQARDLGTVLDEDMVRQADAAADSLARMNRIIGVNFQRILIAMAPLIEQFGTAFAEAAPHILSAANALIRFIGGPALLGISALNEEIGELQEKIEGWQKAQEGLFFGAREFIGFEVEIKLARDKIAELEELAREKQKLIDDINLLGAGGGAVGDDGEIDKTIQKERERAEALLLAIEETHLQVMGLDAEFLDSRAEQEMEKLLELYEARTITEDEFREASLTAWSTLEEQKFQIEEEITEQHRRELEQRLKDEKTLTDQQRREAERQARAKRKIFSDLATLMNSESRKAFELGKAAAIAGASIDAFKAATGAYAALASIPYIGPALGAAAYAAALAAGFVQVQNIKSTSFGGGGGHGGGGGGGGHGGSVPSIPDVPALAPPVEQNQQPQQLFFTVESDSGVVSMEWVRDSLFPSINEALGDGVTLNISTT